MWSGKSKLKIDTFDDLIKALKGEPGEPGGIGPSGKDGKDAEPVDYKRIEDFIIQSIPEPIPGPSGEDGKDTEPVDYKRIEETITKLIPEPVPGKDGKDGKDAEPVDYKRVEDFISQSIPEPIPGKDAEPVDYEYLKGYIENLIPEPIPGKDGENGENGKDGKDAPFSTWTTILESALTLEEEGKHPLVVIPKTNKLVSLDIVTLATGESVNAFFKTRKTYLLNIGKQSINEKIYDESSTHDGFKLHVEYTDKDIIVYGTNINIKTEWRSKVEVYAV